MDLFQPLLYLPSFMNRNVLFASHFSSIGVVCVDSPDPFQKWLPPHVFDHVSALYIDFKVLITIPVIVQMSGLLKTIIPTPTFNSPKKSLFPLKIQRFTHFIISFVLLLHK